METKRNLPAPAMPVDDTGKLGPAMRALPTDRMRAFVTYLVVTGSSNNTAAARAAGYRGTDDTLAVTGHRLAHDERVLSALHEEGRRRMQSAAVLAAGVLVNLAQDPTDKKTQLRAAEALLNRIGLHQTTEHNVNVRNEESGGMIENIRRLATELGLDAKQLLGQYGVQEQKKAEAIDVEAEEVEHDTTGLEDVL